MVFIATQHLGYVGLLGDRTEVDKRTKTLDHIVVDRSDRIESDAEAIRSWPPACRCRRS